MRTNRRLAIAVGMLMLPSSLPSALAVDVPITAVKLIIVDKTASSGTAKASFTAKDLALAKGAGTDAADISAVLQVTYDGVKGQFAMPRGGGWLANSGSVAKYVHTDAPAGGSVKVGVLKPAKVLKIVAKSVGDDPIDISQPPSGAVSVAHTVTNGAETIRHCTTFTGCAHKSIAGGTGWKLVCKTGTPDASCLGFVPPVCGDGVAAEGESCDPPGAACGAGLLCDASCRCHLCGNGDTEEGEQCDDGGTAPGDGCDAFCRLEETASGASTVTTDGESDGATEADPVETTVSAPVAGAITIEETAAAIEPPAGLALLGHQILITAPTASAASPLVFVFLLDQSLVGGLPPGAIIVFRNGVAVADCTGSPTEALPDPCVASRVLLPGNDVEITVRTSHASPWGFGANVAFTLTSTPPGGVCGALKRGGAGGTVAKSLSCGGLSIGGGASTFVEALFRSGGQTQVNGTCDATSCVVSGRSAAETGSSQSCSQPGCPFGPFLPVSNAGTSVCLAHGFTAPPSGAIDHSLGSFTGSFPLAAAVYLTANAAFPCPRCLGGVLGVPGSGSCDPAWQSGVATSYPDAGAPCMPVDVAGSTYDCAPPPGALLPSVPLSAAPLTTGTAALPSLSGNFCASQNTPGAFGCSGNGVSTASCPGGNAPPVPDYIEATGTPAGPITPGPHPMRLASVFCVPSVGGSLGFLITGAANLPGPGVLTLPQTIDVMTVTTSTSTTVISTTSTSTTTSTLPPGSSTRLRLVTATAGGSCGSLRSGGAGGAVRKTLSCGGLDVGAGLSTLTEAPVPAGGLTELAADCTSTPCAISALSAGDTGSNTTCSAAGCTFGPYVPVSNAGTSTCLQNSFAAPAGGLLDSASGTFAGSFPLSTAVYLTANALSPCPRCLGGTVGVTDSGTCDSAWVSGTGPSLDAGMPCTPANASGDTYDCAPPPGTLLSAMSVNLNPLTTGLASDSDPGGLFCPGQTHAGAFGCAGSGSPNAICPGGNTPPVPDYIGVSGLPAGAMTPGSHPITLASSFCIPSVGGSLGFLINGAADLPGPGAVSLPAFAELATVTTSTSTTSTTVPPPTGTRLLLLSGAPTGTCGAVRSGGAGGAIRKALSCGAVNVGAGASTMVEGPVQAGGITELDADCASPPACTIGPLTATDTGSNETCSTTGCVFGAWLPVSNAGTSICLQNSFAAPASGTLDSAAGTFDGTFPLSTAIYLTANGISPCPRCLGGAVGVADSGTCDPAWTSGNGASPSSGAVCTPVNSSGATYDCVPPPASALGAMSLGLTPLTTGTASLSNPGGLFCPGQANAGAFGCAGSGISTATCPGGNVPPVPDYVGLSGQAAGTMTAGPHQFTLASAFCVPQVGGSLGFLVNSAADLPGPGALSLPMWVELAP